MARARLEPASAKINRRGGICCVAKSPNLAYSNLPEHIESVMSKQLAVSAAFSIFIMAIYVLFGPQTAREPLSLDSAPADASHAQVLAPGFPEAKTLLPLLR
jgi:hypothetical protein